MSRLLHALRRTRSLETDGVESELARVLGMLDLTALGVGSTLGLGVYVLAGSVAKTVAGPAVCISFLVAAIASAFAGLCYAEFAARVPRAGSAYVYSYVSVGEFIAFTIGWNLVLEYVIGTASVAKGMANYIDALANNTMRDTLISVMPVNVPHLADYPDFFALVLVLLISALLCVGVKESSRLNNVFTMFNLITVLIVIVTGSIYSDPNNWNIQVEDIPEDLRPQAGVGGFMPFGIAGIMAGAAKCFFGFVGFDCVATAGEEAKQPQRNIPLSIVFSLIIIFSAYFSISTVLTMMWPYYLQDADAPFPYVFTEVGLPAIKWIVTIGAIFALCTSLLGAIFPLPRVLYAMAGDGVIFRWLGIINSKTQTPVLATIISGVFAGIMAMIFNLNQLIDMMSIGTLLAYTIVAISVLILRYDDDSPNFTAKNDDVLKEKPLDLFSILKMTFNLNGLKKPTGLSANIAKAVTLAYFIITIITCVLLQWGSSVTNTVVMSVLGAVLLLCLFILCRLPTQDVSKISFTVPLVPLIPYLSVFMNLYLMVQLDIETWIRFIIWLAVGYSIYFFYGIRHSNLGKEAKTRKSISEASTASVVTDKSIPITNEEVTKC